MKKLLFLVFALSSTVALADDPKNEWHNTTLSDATIKKIQEGQYHYKKCISDEMQKPAYREIDFRKASEDIVKQCESELAKIGTIYSDEKVPEVVAKRHMKQMRLKSTRSVLNELMLADAARKAGN